MPFDTLISRRGSGSIKWDRRPELDPFWVADMDFISPPCVLEAIKKRIDHGVFGYAHAHDGLNEVLLDYLANRHDSHIEIEQIVHLGGLVPALSIAARAFTQPGDALMTCSPIYPPFLGVASDAKISTIDVPHIKSASRWSFDLQAMERAVTPQTKLFLLCNPQNPLGRSFSAEEITAVAEFCHRHDLVLVSDEIHCDLVLNEEERPFFSALRLAEHLRQKLIVLQAPSKTYNIAGMGYAFAVIEDDSTRRRFCAARGHTLSEINCIAYYTAEAAYRDGESWRQQLLAYLRNNRNTLTEFVRSELPGCTIPDIEATYLAWVDCRDAGLASPATFFEKEAKLFLSDGSFFNAPGHFRFNYGCPHARLLEGIDKIKEAFRKRPQ